MLQRILALLAFSGIAWTQQPAFRETLHAPADPQTPVYQPVKDLSGELRSVGTDTMETAMNLWIAGFKALYPQVTIHMEAKGSLTAEPALTEGRAQLAPLSRELMPDELARFRARYGYDPLVIKVALGSYRTPTRTVALTFYVNEHNPIDKLTFAQLDAIYCTTRKRGYKEAISNWGQLGAAGEWANRPIHPVGVMVPDGISNYIRLTICQDGTFKNGIRQEKIDHSEGAVSVLDRIVTDVSQDPSAIGYAGFHNWKPGTRQLALAEADRGPFLKGTFEEIRSARYPLTRYIFICVNRPPGTPLDQKVSEFLKYVLSIDGQRAVEKEGIFMPLPARIVRQERTRLD